MVVPFESVDNTLVCDHSNESYWAALPLFLTIWQNEIQFFFSFELSTFGSERVNTAFNYWVCIVALRHFRSGIEWKITVITPCSNFLSRN